MLNFLKPAPFVEPIQDKEVVDKNYRYWRIRIFYSMFMGYAFFYLSRKSFTFAAPAMIQELGLERSDLGLLATLFSLSYGLSKFLSGILSDRSNARYFMAIGLVVTGFSNLFFGFSSSVTLFAVFWGLNGWFQGFGWPPCARLLTHWYSHNERGSWWSSWNISHNIGGFAIPYIAAFCTMYLGWRYALFIPGTMCIVMGLFLLNRLRDTPQSLGLPSIEAYRNDYGGQQKDEFEKERELSTKEILFKYVLKNPAIWILAISYFFIYVVRMGINDWGALYLVETKGYSLLVANGCVSLFEWGGLFGSLVAGWMSDKIFSAQRGPVNVLFTVGLFGAIFGFWYVPRGYVWLDYVSMFSVGFFVFGPQMLIGMAAAELAHKKAAATASGFAGWFGYAGAAVAGYPLTKITDIYGWEGFFWSMSICCAVAFMFLLPLWSAQAVKKVKGIAVDPKEAPA